MDQYKLQLEKGNGTFSVVFMALSLKTNNYVAIKCMKKKFDSIQKVRKLKQIQALNILSQHQNIIKLIQVLFDQPSGKFVNYIGKLALVFQLMDMNLYQCLKSKKNPLTMQKIKFYMYQVIRSIDYMHKKGIFHRDIKPQNILVKGDLVKLADLGSCKGRYSQQPYTQYISTRWYRSPQCLMTDGYYNQKMDIWGFGCVLFQLITKYPLFPGKDELDQVHKIHNILGTPKQEVLDRFKSKASHMEFNFPQKKGTGLDKLLPNISPDAKNLLSKLLAYDPQQRISAQQAMKHQFFAEYNQNSSNNKDFRSTFFTMKQYNKQNQKSQQNENEEGKMNSVAGRQKKGGQNKQKKSVITSKNHLQKQQDDHNLPKLPILDKTSHLGISQIYKKTFYKKGSHDINLTLVQGKKAL